MDRIEEIKNKLRIIPENDEMMKQFYIYYKEDVQFLLKSIENIKKRSMNTSDIKAKRSEELREMGKYLGFQSKSKIKVPNTNSKPKIKEYAIYGKCVPMEKIAEIRFDKPIHVEPDETIK